MDLICAIVAGFIGLILGFFICPDSWWLFFKIIGGVFGAYILSIVGFFIGMLIDAIEERNRAREDRKWQKEMDREHRERMREMDQEHRERMREMDRERRERMEKFDQEQQANMVRMNKENKERQPREYRCVNGWVLTVQCLDWTENTYHLYFVFRDGLLEDTIWCLNARVAAREFARRNRTVLQGEEQKNTKNESGGGQTRDFSEYEEITDYADACRILDVRIDADAETIKRAWRKKCMEFHPDRLKAKDLAEEFLAFAHKQFIKINAAYEFIKKYRNFSG